MIYEPFIQKFIMVSDFFLLLSFFLRLISLSSLSLPLLLLLLVKDPFDDVRFSFVGFSDVFYFTIRGGSSSTLKIDYDDRETGRERKEIIIFNQFMCVQILLLLECAIRIRSYIGTIENTREFKISDSSKEAMKERNKSSQINK